MSKPRRSTLAALGFAAIIGATVTGALAKPPRPSKGRVTGAVKRVSAAHEQAAGTQSEVETLHDEALDLVTQYRGVQRRIASLKVYNGQLQSLIDNQEVEIGKLQAQQSEVDVVGRQVLPLMQRMVDSLAEFVDLDSPFLLEERTKRVRLLRELLVQADTSNAEKYRRVLEAYQIENEYGRTLEAYKGRLSLDGREKSVEFLQVGRVALVYRSLDGKEYGVWDRKQKSWQPMTSGYEREIGAALRMARQQAAPNLVRVPVSAPEQTR